MKPAHEQGAAMKKTRAKHSSAFRAKVALAAIREQETVPEIARRYAVHANMVYKWKRQLLDNLPRALDSNKAVAGNEASTREAELLQKIGELTVERDFLSNGLGRFR
jgi:transposase